MTRAGLLGQALLVVVAYYLVPVLEPDAGALTWLRGAAALALFAVAVWWISRHLSRAVPAEHADLRLDRLLLIVVGGIAFFALADLVVARVAPGEFIGLDTKTDALYFALATLTTVGFGDVHAEGQLARGLLVVQMAFNLVVLASAAHLLVGELGERTRARRGRRSPRSDEARPEERS